MCNGSKLPFFPCSREPPENPAVRVSHCKDSRIAYWRWDEHIQNKELIDPGNSKVVCFHGSIRQSHFPDTQFMVYLHLFNLHGKCRKIWHTYIGRVRFSTIFLSIYDLVSDAMIYIYIYMKIMSNAYQRMLLVGLIFTSLSPWLHLRITSCILANKKIKKKQYEQHTSEWHTSNTHKMQTSGTIFRCRIRPYMYTIPSIKWHKNREKI